MDQQTLLSQQSYIFSDDVYAQYRHYLRNISMCNVLLHFHHHRSFHERGSFDILYKRSVETIVSTKEKNYSKFFAKQNQFGNNLLFYRQFVDTSSSVFHFYMSNKYHLDGKFPSEQFELDTTQIDSRFSIDLYLPTSPN